MGDGIPLGFWGRQPFWGAILKRFFGRRPGMQFGFVSAFPETPTNWIGVRTGFPGVARKKGATFFIAMRASGSSGF